MQASMSRCRARTRAGCVPAAGTSPATDEAVLDMRRAPRDLTEARRRTGQTHFGNARAQQIVELEHPGLDLRQGPRPVTAVGDAALQALAQFPVLVVDLHVDAVAEPAHESHLAPLIWQAEGGAADQRLARAAWQDLKEVHLLGEDVDAVIRQVAVETP